MRTSDLRAVRAADPSGDDARLAVDGRDDTAWTGSTRRAAVALGGVVRAPRPPRRRPGRARCTSPNERRSHRLPLGDAGPAKGATTCDAPPRRDRAARGSRSTAPPRRPRPQGEMLAQPTHRSWFVDTDACGLRLVIDRDQRRPARRARGAGPRGRARRAARRRGERRRRLRRLRRVGCDRRDVRAALGGRARPGTWTLRVDLRPAHDHRPRPPRARLRRDQRASRGLRAAATRSLGRRCTTCSRSARTARRFSPIAGDPLRAGGGAAARCGGAS